MKYPKEKFFLRVLILFLFYLLYTVLVHFSILNISHFLTTNFYWTIVLAFYLHVFGSVFEMYNLQTSSNQFQIIKSIILTSSTTVLFYLLTPLYTPVLPSNRLQIIFFFLAIFMALLLWRIFYVKFLASHRFFKNAILVCDKEQLQELISGLENADPHYKIIGFVNSDGEDSFDINIAGTVNIKTDDLEYYVRNNSISEIVIASQKTEGITVNLYNQLIHF